MQQGYTDQTVIKLAISSSDLILL